MRAGRCVWRPQAAESHQTEEGFPELEMRCYYFWNSIKSDNNYCDEDICSLLNHSDEAIDSFP